MMFTTAYLFVAVLVAAVGVDAELDCSSPLRILQPWRFTHCSSCFYGTWSDWYRIGNSAYSSHCKSGYAYKVERNRKDIYGSAKCEDKNETSYQCEPTASQKADILINVLGLKRQSHVHSGNTTVHKRMTCSHKKICRRNQGKRDLIEEPFVNEEVNITTLDDYIVPEQFNIDKYLSHTETHRRKRQNEQQSFMLFILDASGSIGAANFEKMKDVVKVLALFRCNTKIAVMSYSTFVYGQYCYDCNQRNPATVDTMIKSIRFSNGATASGDAIQCACNYMLGPQCGFPRHGLAVVDVIFISDGKSNRGTNVCSAANCWESVRNSVSSLHVLPFGIGSSVGWRELKCLKGNYATDISVRSFSDLETVMKNITNKAVNGEDVCTSNFIG